MKFAAVLLAIFITVAAQSQSSNGITIVLNSKNRDALGKIDSLSIRSVDGKHERKFTVYPGHRSVFTVSGLTPGTYNVTVHSKEVFLPLYTIHVCTKCSKDFEFYAIRKDDNKDQTYTRVEVSPAYKGGRKAMALDFTNSLSKKEKRLLQKSKDFRVKVYITKAGQLSDASVDADKLRPKIKKIIMKGLDSLDKWESGIINGKYADAPFLISKQMLFGE